jgi:hypothetical protein
MVECFDSVTGKGVSSDRFAIPFMAAQDHDPVSSVGEGCEEIIQVDLSGTGDFDHS